MKRATMIVGLCGLVGAGAVTAGWGARSAGDRPSAAAAREAFEQLKALEGTWVMCDDEGKPTDMIASVYHVTSGGSAVMETMLPGQSEEMLTVYFLDGETLRMTHYCMLANRPELAATRIQGATIDWVCDGRSACCGHEDHMHAATFDLSGHDRITTTWRGDKEGEEDHEVTFTLQRVDDHHGAQDHADHDADR